MTDSELRVASGDIADARLASGKARGCCERPNRFGAAPVRKINIVAVCDNLALDDRTGTSMCAEVKRERRR